MMQRLKEIEPRTHDRDPIYMRFSDCAVERTDSYVDGEVNVDVDQRNEVIGVELLSVGPDELRALASIIERHNLDIAPLFRTNGQPSQEPRNVR